MRTGTTLNKKYPLTKGKNPPEYLIFLLLLLLISMRQPKKCKVLLLSRSPLYSTEPSKKESPG